MCEDGMAADDKSTQTFAADSQIMPRVTLCIPMPKGAAVPAKPAGTPPAQPEPNRVSRG